MRDRLERLIRPRFRTLLACALLTGPLLAATGAALHPESISQSQLTVAGDQAVLRLRAQVLSFLEVLPELDADQSGAVDEDELRALEPLLFEVVTRGYRLGRVASSGKPVPLEPVPVSLALRPADLDLGRGSELGALEFELFFQAGAPIEQLEVAVDLFPDTSPNHLDYLTLQIDGQTSPVVVFDRFSKTHRLPAPRPKRFRPFLRSGFLHILGGWDHLAFLAALLLTASRPRSLLVLVTGFTIAHSLTLGLVSAGYADTRGFESLIEAGIALSIAWVAAEVALYPERARSRWPDALLFGLLHGLGFAGFLRASLQGQASIWVPLGSFNLGVELGQLLVVGLAALVLLRLPPRDPGHLAPRWVRRAGGASLAVLGLIWFFQRW